VRHHSWDLLTVIGLALLASAVALVSRGSNPALIATALPLALFLPGYALVAALLPSGQLGFPERAALGLGLSITITVLGGLLLDAFGAPLTRGAWQVWLAAATIALAGVGLFRRRQGRLGPAGALAAQMTPREALLFSAGALLIGLALGVGGIGIAAPPGEAFTEFWALSEQAGERSVIRVGLRNEEGRPVTYRVAVEAGDRLLAEWPQVSVAAGKTWRAQATVSEALFGEEIYARLYRSGDPDGEPYRQARLVVERSDLP
jgi:uncharacterized membrane protein